MKKYSRMSSAALVTGSLSRRFVYTQNYSTSVAFHNNHFLPVLILPHINDKTAVQVLFSITRTNRVEFRVRIIITRNTRKQYQ